MKKALLAVVMLLGFTGFAMAQTHHPMKRHHHSKHHRHHKPMHHRPHHG